MCVVGQLEYLAVKLSTLFTGPAVTRCDVLKLLNTILFISDPGPIDAGIDGLGSGHGRGTLFPHSNRVLQPLCQLGDTLSCIDAVTEFSDNLGIDLLGDSFKCRQIPKFERI